MEIEKIFKNLILIDFAILILIVISSMYQSNDLNQINQYLEKGYLMILKIFKLTIINFIFFISIMFELTLSIYLIMESNYIYF